MMGLSRQALSAINIAMVLLMWVLFLLYHYTQMRIFMLLLYVNLGVWVVFMTIPLVEDIGGVFHC
jgi:hypothetical protein